MNDGRIVLTEVTILNKVKALLSGRVNDLLSELRCSIPLIEFSGYAGADTVCPSVVLSSCERTEKERLIFLDAYSLTITFILPETSESETNCYMYVAAVKRVILENPTLDRIVDRAVITGIKYAPPEKPYCGEGWKVAMSFRLTVEGYK